MAVTPFAFSKSSVTTSAAKHISGIGFRARDVESSTLAYVTVTGDGLWFRFDTASGDPSEGDHYLPENETIVLDNEDMIQNFRGIAESGTAKVAVTLCR